MRKTKIICTLGPASDSPEMIRQLMLSGMNGARFNFSHATHEYAKEKLAVVKQLRQELKLPVATILDTKGPEIRIGTFKDHKVTLKEGQLFTLTTEEVEGTENQVSITYKDLPKDIEEGRTVLLDDGLIEMKVMSKTETAIVCRVENGGVISDRKGINVPGTKLSMPFISERDRSDIIFGIEEGFDCIAASFTRNATDILAVRKILDEHDCHSINIIAKIENAEGVENIDQILRVVDGIMVARGDMGVEIPLEDVPILQKKLIKKAYLAGKQVITATQMLDSMIKNPRPTRAESTDVANAIYDGTSAIMLSGETAAGTYPVEALKTMVRIAERTEEAINYVRRFQSRETIANFDVTNAISHATCTTAHDLGASAIITVTMSGITARQLSKFRPASPIVACTNRDTVYHQLSLSWGVIPMRIQTETDSESLFEHAVEAAQRAGLVHSGDLVVITAGVPLGVSGTTNMMKVDVVGHVLVTGEGVTEKRVTARVCVAETAEELEERFQEGDIIVTQSTDNSWIEYLHTAGGVITEQAGINSHAAIVGLAMNKPVIVGAHNATKILKTGSVVLLDAEKGLVSRS